MKLITAAEVSEHVHASTEEVWHALTTPALLKKYFFGADVRSTWNVGDPITFTGEYEGKSYQDKGTIRSSRPNNELSFTHWSALGGKPDKPENYHLVTINLDQRGDDTTVTLRQDDQDGKPVDEQTRRQFEKNWSMVLKGLKQVVESRSS
jgi:uncharacterized protein YndB with AHSA1/START domain